MEEQTLMQDNKDTTWTHDRSAEGEQDSAAVDRKTNEGVGNKPDADGWQQYRRWISKAPAPRSRRAGVDPTLYTWKGYRNWSEQIKRNWSDS